MDEKSHRNHFSIIFGILCLSVVYLHSNWCNGFDIYTLGINSKLIGRITSLALTSAVPSFFICWGYLSHKYFYSSDSSLSFLIKKILQFYPLYFFSIIISFAVKPEMFSLPLWKIILGVLGLYYENGFVGGNIYIVVIFVIITTSLFKFLNITKWKLICFCIICLFISKILPHGSRICYIRYFGYYTAFWFGVSLRELLILEEKKEGRIFYTSTITKLLFLISISTPILNYFDIKITEIQYHPNSPEHLFFCFLLLYVGIRVVNYTGILKSESIILNFINTVGNNAYGHFIVQYFVINLLIFIGSYLKLNSILVQFIIIFSTSYISVFLVLKLYNRFESLLFSKVNFFAGKM